MSRKEEVKALLKNAIQKELGERLYEAFIFGSQANSAELKRADIDVGIETPEGLGHVSYANLLKRFDELPMLYNVDLVDFSQVTEDFKTTALKNTEAL